MKRARCVALAPHLFRVPLVAFGTVNAFLVLEDDGSVTLIDAGFTWTTSRILAALTQLDKEPSDVQRILLTHAHLDHAGGARDMKARSGGQLYVHEHDADYLRQGRSPASDPVTTLGRLVTKLSFGRFPQVEVETESTLSDGQLLEVGGGLRVVHTPGHTPGHVSFLHEESGTLIAGDAIFNLVGMTFSPPFFCHDLQLSRQTAIRFAELDYQVAAFAHGIEIRNRAREKIRAFLSRRGMLDD